MPQSQQQADPPSILRQESDTNNDVQESASPSSYLGLNGRASAKPTPKSVSINHEPEVISPLILGDQKAIGSDFDLDQRNSPRRPPVKSLSSKRLSGRLSSASSTFSWHHRNASVASELGDEESSESTRDHRSSHHHLEHLIDQVTEWIKHERQKRGDRNVESQATPDDINGEDGVKDQKTRAARRDSNVSSHSFDLDKLESIIKHNLSFEKRPRYDRSRLDSYLRRKPSKTLLGRKQSWASSDTEGPNYDSDVFVPSCDAVLDNSKTLSYAGGAPSDSEHSSDDLERTTSYKDLDAWAKFKFEIVRLTHTLRLKGWRKVPMKMSNKITIERLSGALTNAVYVVSPPEDLPKREKSDDGSKQGSSKKPPPKLLLRIYGPNVDHLIDREAELAILRRLAKKKIGPLLLGTFANGRFEEYFYAQTLRPDDLRNPITSRQIAKRMRELHDGVELLEQERNDGAFVWRNWDKWVGRVERIVCWLDEQIERLEPGFKPTGPDAWKRRGFICGAPWKEFRHMVETYRQWLEKQYGGTKGIRQRLVFAHNDTQYGNILRLKPTGDSPLLLPANSHKQLVVIDFEYANANLPGLEFANHFTEWCYNYHDEQRPYAFHANWYPTPEEQDRFVRAYVRHRSQYNVTTPTLSPSTPTGGSDSPQEKFRPRPTSSISDFMLDARTPTMGPSNVDQQEEAALKEKEDKEVNRLLQEARVWRLANTAQWVAWGIIQAKVAGMPNFDEEEVSKKPESTTDEEAAREDLGDRAEVYKHLTAQQEDQEANGSEKEEAEEEFDCLGYSQHRAMFFWADAIRFGFAKEEDLPEEMRGKLKTVPY